MKKRPETMEDLLCYLECARDGLLMIHNVLEGETASTDLLMNAVFGIYNHLDYIAKSMMEHLEHIPSDVLEKAGEEVNA